MPVSLFREGDWGDWVDVKNGAATLLEKELRKAKAKGKVTIFMSSSTDPYQPIESKEKVTLISSRSNGKGATRFSTHTNKKSTCQSRY